MHRVKPYSLVNCHKVNICVTITWLKEKNILNALEVLLMTSYI